MSSRDHGEMPRHVQTYTNEYHLAPTTPVLFRVELFSYNQDSLVTLLAHLTPVLIQELLTNLATDWLS